MVRWYAHGFRFRRLSAPRLVSSDLRFFRAFLMLHDAAAAQVSAPLTPPLIAFIGHFDSFRYFSSPFSSISSRHFIISFSLMLSFQLSPYFISRRRQPFHSKLIVFFTAFFIFFARHFLFAFHFHYFAFFIDFHISLFHYRVFSSFLSSISSYFLHISLSFIYLFHCAFSR